MVHATSDRNVAATGSEYTGADEPGERSLKGRATVGKNRSFQVGSADVGHSTRRLCARRRRAGFALPKSRRGRRQLLRRATLSCHVIDLRGAID